MNRLNDVVEKIRSKNAGPFWLTIDIFCGAPDKFQRVSEGLRTDAVANLFQVEPAELKRFDIAELNVVKLSLPRPEVQGTRGDRDMHGASYACILSDIEV